MKPYTLFETLAKRSKKLYEEELDSTDTNTRILVAASIALLKGIVADDPGSFNFEFDNEIHKALLLKAVSEINPDAELSDEDRDSIANIQEFTDGSS